MKACNRYGIPEAEERDCLTLVLGSRLKFGTPRYTEDVRNNKQSFGREANIIQARRWRWRSTTTRTKNMARSNELSRSSSQKMEASCSRRWYVPALQQYLQRLTTSQQIQNPTAVCPTTSPFLICDSNNPGHDCTSSNSAGRNHRRWNNISGTVGWRTTEAGRSLHRRGPPPPSDRRWLRYCEDGVAKGTDNGKFVQ